MTDRGSIGRAQGANERVVRIVCDASSHEEITVANYRRLHDGDSRYTGSVWVWDEAKAQGGSPIVGELRQRERLDRRKLTAEQVAAGQMLSEADAKRIVRDLGKSSDDLECAKCGLRLTINRKKLDIRMDACVDAGVSRIGLPALVAIMTKQ
jgi:hypothetical protein